MQRPDHMPIIPAIGWGLPFHIMNTKTLGVDNHLNRLWLSGLKQSNEAA